MSWLVPAALLLLWLGYRVHANRRLAPLPVLDPSGRPYEVTDVPLSDGTSVALIDTGEGPAILLIPGADGVHQTWRYQVPALAARFRILAPDLRTFIDSDANFDRFCLDMQEILDARNVPAAVVVGQSLGGAIALRLAVLSPERVRALVIVNSLARISYRHVGLNRTLLVPVAIATTRYLPTLLARWFGRLWGRLDVWVFDASAGLERVIDYVLWTGPRTVPPAVSTARVELLRGEDLRPQLPQIAAPTLVVKGPRDTYVPVAWSREIAGLIPGASYVEVPGTGHVSHISMPDAFNRILLDWLRGIDCTPHSTEAEA